jgi:hypothetical protein
MDKADTFCVLDADGAVRRVDIPNGHSGSTEHTQKQLAICTLVWERTRLSSGCCYLGPEVGQTETDCEVANITWVLKLVRLKLTAKWPISLGSWSWPDWTWLSSDQCLPNSGQKTCFADKCRVVFLRPWNQMARITQIWPSEMIFAKIDRKFPAIRETTR